jgi:N-ethylmaleimide reductase
MNYPSLFSPLQIGPHQLRHRLVMAPLTRMRAEKPSLAPRPLNAEYYAQRATPGGLIIAEASPVVATGFGSPGVPGIYSEHQIKGWREVVDAVHGYLIEQFLQSHTNLRTDRYGGSIENRARFLMEVTQAVIDVWDADRVGVRLSPYGVANDSGEPDPMPLYSHAIKLLDPLGLAYLHFVEPRSSGAGRAEVNHQNVPAAMVLFRPIWRGTLITAGGFTGETADAAISAGHADAIAFGRIFISNPDLPRRLQLGFPLTPYNRATFYGGEEIGYTDYPVYGELEQA